MYSNPLDIMFNPYAGTNTRHLSYVALCWKGNQLAGCDGFTPNTKINLYPSGVFHGHNVRFIPPAAHEHFSATGRAPTQAGRQEQYDPEHPDRPPWPVAPGATSTYFVRSLGDIPGDGDRGGWAQCVAAKARVQAHCVLFRNEPECVAAKAAVQEYCPKGQNPCTTPPCNNPQCVAAKAAVQEYCELPPNPRSVAGGFGSRSAGSSMGGEAYTIDLKAGDSLYIPPRP